MSVNLDASGIGQLALRLGIVTEDQLRECLGELDDKKAPASEMLRLMERKKYLTPWQAHKLVKGDLKVEDSTGSLLFDRENGRVFSATAKTRMKGDMMTFAYEGNELTGAVDLTIDSSVEMQPAAK